jgi:5'/3'-nucleotidase SurE
LSPALYPEYEACLFLPVQVLLTFGEGKLLQSSSAAAITGFRQHLAFSFLKNWALAREDFQRIPSLILMFQTWMKKKIKSYKITQQGRWVHNGNAVIEKLDPRGKKYYWIGEGPLVFDQRGDTDFEAVTNSYISITPLHLDLTNYSSIRELKKWKL